VKQNGSRTDVGPVTVRGGAKREDWAKPALESHTDRDDATVNVGPSPSFDAVDA
jgi:hypothetical protein